MKKVILLLLLVLIPWCLSAATITVTNPTTTSTWRIGTTQEIRWTYSGFTNPATVSVNIRLRRGGSAFCDIVASVPLTDGKYSWPISTATCPALVPGSYTVRVRKPGGETGDSPEFAIAAERVHPVGPAIPVQAAVLPLLDEESWGWESISTRVGDTTHVQEKPVPECKVGDAGNNTKYVSYLSFDLSALSTLLPSGARTYQVLLMLKKERIAGNPFRDLFQFQVVQATYQRRPGRNSVPNPTAYLYNSLCPCREVDVSGIDLTNLFNQLRSSGESRLQVRLQFMQPGNQDGLDDFVEFKKGANGCTLAVKYTE